MSEKIDNLPQSYKWFDHIQWDGTFGGTWIIRDWVNQRSTATWLKSTPWYLVGSGADCSATATGVPYFLLSSELGVLHINPMDIVYYLPSSSKHFLVFTPVDSKSTTDMCL